MADMHHEHFERCCKSATPHTQAYELMLDGGYAANTMTVMLLLEGCNFKGRGLSEVAMVLYGKLATAHGGDVPVIVKSQLLQVGCLRSALTRAASAIVFCVASTCLHPVFDAPRCAPRCLGQR